jgi:hypothetical protein
MTIDSENCRGSGRLSGGYGQSVEALGSTDKGNVTIGQLLAFVGGYYPRSALRVEVRVLKA